MTHDDFIAIVKRPETVKAEYDADLKELTDRYPYYVPARLLLVKALQQSHSIHYAANLRTASIYCSNRRWLYYYLFPDKLLSTEPYQRNRAGKSSGDYFDMINTIEQEGGDTNQSLKNLAERLKSARAMVLTPTVQPTKKPIESTNIEVQTIEASKVTVQLNSEDLQFSTDKEISETNAKKLIKEHKFKDAIEILTALNLNNPKKSVYFADQIRFLEKVIANSKK